MDTLKQAREKRGIKQMAVADAIGVTRQTYAKYEENQLAMTVKQAVDACHFIGCDINEIFFGSEVSETNAGAVV